MRDSFVFYRSFYESFQELETEDKVELIDSICAYALDDTEPTAKGAVKAIFLAIKPQILKNNQRYENGRKGGRPPEEEKPKGNQTEPNDNQTETETKPNDNQTKPNDNQTEPNDNQSITKPEPNDNVNVNDLDYEPIEINTKSNNARASEKDSPSILSHLLENCNLKCWYNRNMYSHEQITVVNSIADIICTPLTPKQKQEIYALDEVGLTKIIDAIWRARNGKTEVIDNERGYVWECVADYYRKTAALRGVNANSS